MKITGEQAFSVPTNSFAISASEDAYTLNYSVDGETWTPYEAETPAGETAIVNFGVKGMLYKLDGNTGDVFIQY